LAGFGGTKDLGLQSVSARQVNASNERSEAKKREGSGLRVGRLKSENENSGVAMWLGGMPSSAIQGHHQLRVDLA
jgi:hypothetical protein